ncbi:MAG TPA: class I SAM-dependent methyltransferase [Herpetosiphonaceae bacterium]
MDQRFAATRASYDEVAPAYAERIFAELRDKPFDRQWLDQLAAETDSGGWLADLGCGPGQVARYLADRGARVCGLDLSRGMLAQAARLNPAIPFLQGSLLALPVADGAWAGAAAFYSIIHVPPPALPDALREARRALRPGGSLLLAFHLGAEPVHLDEWWGRAVDVDFFFFGLEEMIDALRGAGFEISRAAEREPYPEVEHPSRRGYVVARRPLGP